MMNLGENSRASLSIACLAVHTYILLWAGPITHTWPNIWTFWHHVKLHGCASSIMGENFDQPASSLDPSQLLLPASLSQQASRLHVVSFLGHRPCKPCLSQRILLLDPIFLHLVMMFPICFSITYSYETETPRICEEYKQATYWC